MYNWVIILVAAILIVAAVGMIASYINKKQQEKKKAAAEKARSDEISKRVAQQIEERHKIRDSHLIDGEPTECTDVPDVSGVEGPIERLKGANGKTYFVSTKTKDFYDYFNSSDWDPFLRLAAAERASDEMYQQMKKAANVDSFVERTAYLIIRSNCFAAEAYAYGSADPADLYQSERAVLRRLKDRNHALNWEGYYGLPYPQKRDYDKAIHLYARARDLWEKYQEKISRWVKESSFKDLEEYMLRAYADLGHLYSRQGNVQAAIDCYTRAFFRVDKDAPGRYMLQEATSAVAAGDLDTAIARLAQIEQGSDKVGLKDTELDIQVRLDIFHALAEGHPGNAAAYEKKLMEMMHFWSECSLVGRTIEQVDLLNGYCLLSDEDKARIAAGPEEAVAVYNEGMAKRNVYCTYMVGRCALYGYGGVKDKDLAETCLERASIRNSFPAAFLLKKLAVGDSDKEKQYDRRLTNIVTHVIRELRDQ